MVILTCLLTTSWLALQIPPPVAAAAKAPGLRERRDEILTRERVALKAWADRLRATGKAAEADQVPLDPAEAVAADGSSRFVLLPEVVEARPDQGVAGVEAIRAEAANALFDLAIRAAKPPESFALADECLRGVVARLPGHAEARRLLGYVPRQGGWATPFAARKLAEDFVKDATYGWVKRDWVPHLTRGELPDRGLRRWLPAAEADALRRDWATKWEITTEHFRISTNVPLNEAISFGRELEQLHQLFFALMADVIAPARLPIAQRFKKPDAKPTPPNPKDAYQVYYFATRDEYANYVTPILGANAKTSLGTYCPPKKEAPAGYGGISYFFNDAGGQLDVTSTLYHEASHQLLFESAGATDYARNAGQFWVFEGLGTYFETLQEQPDGTLRIGGLVGPRIAQAKRRLIDRREFIPIQEFVSYNRPRFQGDVGGGDIFLNYAESMALAVFLMQADGEKHREAFLEYVLDAYKGRFRGGSGRSLEDQLGVRYPKLDRALLEHLGRAEVP